MDTLIETERLVLRRFRELDARSLFELNDDPEVLRYTGDVPFDSVSEAAAFLKKYTAYDRYGYGRWAVILKEPNVFIGWCGLKYHKKGFTDLGFRFLREYWNHGYATEAARACLEFGFNNLQLREIIGRAAIRNLASIRVLEKLGMSFWKYDACEGIPEAAYYRLTREEFQERD